MADRRRFAAVLLPVLFVVGFAIVPARAAAAAQSAEPAPVCFEITVGWSICAVPAVAPAQPPGPCATGVAVPSAATNPGLVADCTALLAAKDALRGTAPLNWDAGEVIRAWDGVTVSGMPPRVTELRLGSRGLTGSIPAALGSLAQLEYLALYGNRLTGAIPPALGALARLNHLSLGGNRLLSGPIPPELGNLAQLEYLKLGQNRLTGAIPPELGNLARLEYLWLFDNQLTGAIPPELGNLARLVLLWLSGNRLTGAIPPELGALARLEVLTLNNNRLTGPIPPELGNLAQLEILLVGFNRLTGAIPPALGNLAQLETLLLGGNNLTGCLPRELPRELTQVIHNAPDPLGLDHCGLPSTTLTYGAPVTTGSVTGDGDYAFLTDPDDLTTTVTTYEGLRTGLREGNPIGLVLHQNDIFGAAQAAFYDLVEDGDLVEWREANDCWVRYQVEEIHDDPTGTPARKLLTIQVYSYAYTGCNGTINTTGTRTFTWTPENIRTGNIPAPLYHGPYVFAPKSWTGTLPALERLAPIATTWPPDPLPNADLGSEWTGGVSAGGPDDGNAVFVTYWHTSEWRLEGLIYRLPIWPLDAGLYNNDPADFDDPEAIYILYELRVVDGFPAVVSYEQVTDVLSNAGVSFYDADSGVVYAFSGGTYEQRNDPDALIALARQFLPDAP